MRPYRLPCLAVLTALACPLVASAQQGAGPPTSSTIDRNPGIILNRLLDGPQVTETDPNAEDRLPGLLALSITSLFAAIQQVIPVLPFEAILGIGDPDDPTSGGGTRQIVLTEIANNGENTFVEVSNTSGLRLDLDDWAICVTNDARDCQFLTGLTLDPNPPQSRTSLVLQLGGNPDPEILDTFLFLEVVATQGELALYDFGPTSPADPLNGAAMQTYIAWGAVPQIPGTLQQVAIDAAEWRRTETISLDGLRDSSFQLNSTLLINGAIDASGYIEFGFANNTLGSTEVSTAGSETDGGGTDSGIDDGTGGDTTGDDRGRAAFSRRNR